MSSLKVNINFDDVISEMGLNRKDAENMTKIVLQTVTVAIANAWKNAAKKELHSTRGNYMKSLYIVEEGRMTNSIILGGRLNNMLESGASPFDIKEGMAKSSKRKFSKAGTWYMSIPFRWATPGSLGESEAFSGVMPMSIYRAVSSLTSSKTDLGGGKSKGSSLKAVDIPNPQNEIKSRAALIDPISKRQYEEYKHKSSIYEGIGKSEKQYEGGSSGSYNSFRTISQNSNKNAFIHPGLRAGDFANKGLKSVDLDTIVNNTIDKFLSTK